MPFVLKHVSSVVTFTAARKVHDKMVFDDEEKESSNKEKHDVANTTKFLRKKHTMPLKTISTQWQEFSVLFLPFRVSLFGKSTIGMSKEKGKNNGGMSEW